MQPVAIVLCWLLVALSSGVLAQPTSSPLCELGRAPFGPGDRESEGGTGVSFEDAVVLRNPVPEKIKGSELALVYEKRFLMRCFPGYRLLKQELVPRNGRAFDVMTVQTSLGVAKTVYFDITQFWRGQ